MYELHIQWEDLCILYYDTVATATGSSSKFQGPILVRCSLSSVGLPVVCVVNSKKVICIPPDLTAAICNLGAYVFVL